MDVNDVLVFVKVVQAGSFSRAAKILGMPVSTVSRRVAELEDELGVTLLHRTTRSLKITDIGSAYFEHGRTIASEIEKAESLGTNFKTIPQGILKITAPTDFGDQFLGKIVSGFLKENPQVQTDIVLTERVVDLISEGFDLAIRIGDLEDSTHLARKIGNIELQLYASPTFIRKHGEPKSVKDLLRFECIRFTADEELDRWKLKGPKGVESVEVTGKISCNNMALIRDFALLGEGIALMPYFLCAEEVQAGRLKVILKDWVFVSGPIHVVFPGQKFLVPKVRAFIDHLMTFCSDVRWQRHK